MELGEKILRARQEMGLSQRQLCGGEITRNMLSQIEHGTAHPSMKTLRYLADRLEKPVSYFLDEEAEPVPAYPSFGPQAPVLPPHLEKPVSYFLDEEAEPVPAAQMMDTLTLLQKAEKAMEEKRYPYVKELLEKIETPYPELARRKLLLLSRLPGADIGALSEALPSMDEELLLRARAALDGKNLSRALHLLEAMEERDTPQWHMLMGRLLLKQKNYAAAAGQFHMAENVFPMETAAYLEQCYRELEDFKQAYFYACKQKT